MKRVILSYDYELFFGVRSGTIDNTLIEPTNRLLDAMEDVGFSGNFFVDYLMMKYLKKENTERTLSDYDKVENQLKDMVRRGHRIELHLHPHWLDAKYNGDGTWNFDDYSHYSLKSLDSEHIVKLFVDGASYLNRVAREVDPSYSVCAFRAGGWAVQPFELLNNAFIKSGITIDSSTGYGCYRLVEGSSFDFRNMPNKDYYRFSNDVCEEDKDGKFLEVPITTHKWSLYDKIQYKIQQFQQKGYNTRITDGTHSRPGTKKPSFFYRFKLLLPSKIPIMYTLSMNNPNVLRRNIKKCNREIICFIDHPKDMTPATCDCIHSLGNGLCKSVNYCDLKLILQ